MYKTIISILIGIILSIGILHAEEDDLRPEQLPGAWMEQVPVICLSNETLWDFAKEANLQPFNVSYGRAGGKPTGEVVYIITYWVNFEDNNSMATVNTPRSDYSCVMFRSFDIQLNPNLQFELPTRT